MEAEQISGFVCEINEETFKVYAFKEGLFDVPINGEEPELGRWVMVFDVKEGEYEFGSDLEIPYFNVYEKDGVTWINLLAICPCEYALPQEIGDKFADKVWNPFVGYLNDDNDVFKAQVSGGEVAEIEVKYAPSGDYLFEVMKLVIWDKDPEEAHMAYMHMTPWTAEFMCTHMKPAWEMFKDDFVSTNRTKIVGKDRAAIGICIKHNHPNPAYDPNAQGSQRECAILWSQQFGLTRWPNEPFNISVNPISFGKNPVHTRNPIKKLGKWYSYALNDKRAKDKTNTRSKNLPPQSSFMATTAKQPIEAPMPKPTVVDKKGNVQITCCFAFSHKMFESEQNTLIEDWYVRRRGISTTAHFADIELGKVEVYPFVAVKIIQIVEQHKKELQESDPVEYEKRKNEVIIVEGRATLLKNWLENSIVYPKCGLFFLEYVDTLFYLQGGKVIWKASDEKVEEEKKEDKKDEKEEHKEDQKKDQSEEEKATAAFKSLVL